jgi:two-component system phosphate regulon response regulator PhoB
MTAEHDAGDNPKLLIVDDDPMTCRLIKIQLELESYVCATLSDPDCILQTLANESPDLVLVDFHLGSQGGLDLLQIVRNSEEYSHLPMILMSATDYRRECMAAGADGFVLKPFTLEQLTKSIEEVLEYQKE